MFFFKYWKNSQILKNKKAKHEKIVKYLITGYKMQKFDKIFFIVDALLTT